MEQGIEKLLLWFSLETGVLDALKTNITYVQYAIAIFAILFCYFGFKLFRGVFSLLTFMAVALVFSITLRDVWSWGTVVTAFVVFGVLLSFFAFNWHYLGAFVLSFLIGANLLYQFSHSLLIAIAFGVFAGMLTMAVPVLSISILTATWGGSVAIALGMQWADLGIFSYLLLLGLVISGVSVQLATNHKQTLFKQAYWLQMKEWLQKPKGSRQ